VRLGKLYIFILVAVFVFNRFNNVFSQNEHSIRERNTFLSAGLQFNQIKEQLNFGLVFRGPAVDLQAGLTREYKHFLFEYSGKLNLSLLFSKGMTGISLNLQPVNGFLGIPVLRSPVIRIFLGPSLTTEYRYQLYPDLQGGQSYWFSGFILSPRLRLDYITVKKIFRLNLLNSVGGFTSRPDDYRDPYFYSFKFADIVSNLHHDLRFGSFDQFNLFTLDLEMIFLKKKSDLSIGYGLEYLTYHPAPELKCLTHSIRLKFYLKKHRS